jgi:hypothetical protein
MHATTTASHHATNLFSIGTFESELNEIPTKVLLYRKKLHNHVGLFLHSQKHWNACFRKQAIPKPAGPTPDTVQIRQML